MMQNALQTQQLQCIQLQRIQKRIVVTLKAWSTMLISSPTPPNKTQNKNKIPFVSISQFYYFEIDLLGLAGEELSTTDWNFLKFSYRQWMDVFAYKNQAMTSNLSKYNAREYYQA